jgi:hypothetical protein
VARAGSGSHYAIVKIEIVGDLLSVLECVVDQLALGRCSLGREQNQADEKKQ